MNPVRIAIAGACVLAVVACQRRERTSETGTTSAEQQQRSAESDRGRTNRPTQMDQSGTTTTTGATTGAVSFETASSRIVAARCEREAACNNIGAKKRYVDRTVCTHELGVKLADDLKASECTHGVDAKLLDECIAGIQKESCGGVGDNIARAGNCKSSDICLKAGENR